MEPRSIGRRHGMAIPDEVERDLSVIDVPRWGRVLRCDEHAAWQVVDESGQPVEPIRRYLRDLVGRGRSTSSARSYAFDLLRWWRWLRAIEMNWDRATSTEVKDFVLWLMATPKPRDVARTVSAARARHDQSTDP